MGQTLGGQLLGNWYDIIGWAVTSSVFFYIAFGASHFSVQQKEKLPAFLLNKKLCISIALIMALLSIGKTVQWW